jgi:hypothetical protein
MSLLMHNESIQKIVLVLLPLIGNYLAQTKLSPQIYSISAVSLLFYISEVSPVRSVSVVPLLQ